MSDAIYYIYIDDLVECAQHSEAMTGIQRVVVEMIKGMRLRFGSDNVRLIANRHSRKFAVFSSELFDPEWTYDQEQFCRFFSVPAFSGRKVEISLHSLLSVKYGGLRLLFNKLRLHFRNFCTRGKTFRKIGATTNKRDVLNHQNYREARRFELSFKPMDVVYIPGEFWNRPVERLLDVLGAGQDAAKVVLYLHDLIPLAAPEYTGKALFAPYQRVFNRLLRRATRIIVNSNYTASDVTKYIRAHPDVQSNIEITVVPLAHEFSGDATRLDFLQHRELAFITRLPYVLVVGTANARKNAWAAAYVWNTIRETLGSKTPRIIFVDRDIFLNEPFRNLMDATKNLFGLAEFISAPTDAQLAYLYEHCLFTIYPSLYEGWGLPVGESIWMKKPVVAANATSIPEVGDEFVDYFDPQNLQSLYETCLKLIIDTEYRTSRIRNLAQKNLRRWTTVISETIDAIEGIRRDRKDALRRPECEPVESRLSH